jgi:exosortase
VAAATGTPPRARQPVREIALGTAVIVACCVAFHVTLRSLGQALLIDSPLAYLGLVPGGAVLIAAVRSRRRATEPDIEDRQLDLIVGVPLLVSGLAGQLVLHHRLGDTYWLLRLDLLMLPLFAAGATALLLGVRTMWRVRLGLALLAFAWPLPWAQLLSVVQSHVSTLTTGAAAALATPLNLAQRVPGSDGSLFVVEHGTDTLRLSVASACAGLNGAVSYLVVGTVLLGLTAGPTRRKLLWLAVGVLLAWTLNLLRILLIFFVGGHWGLAVAMEVLHPVLGLVLSNVGIAVMLWRLRSFGLSLAGRGGRVAPQVPALSVSRPVPVWGSLVVCAGVAVGAVANGQLAGVAGLGDPVGGVSAISVADQPLDLPGFGAASLGSVPWASQYFGEASTWQRSLLMLSPDPAAPAALRKETAAPILADVVTTPSLLRMRTYSIEACYEFHGFDVRSSRQVPLSPGLMGRLLSYWDPRDGRDWSALYWERPVLDKSGGVSYERLVLLMVDTRNRPVPVISSSGGAAEPRVTAVVPASASTQERVRAVGAVLTTVARAVVAIQESRSESSDGVVRLRAEG